MISYATPISLRTQLFLKCVSEHLVFAAIIGISLSPKSPFDLPEPGRWASDPALKSTLNLKFEFEFEIELPFLSALRGGPGNITKCGEPLPVSRHP